LKSEIRNLQGSGMHLVEIVALDFAIEERSSRANVSDILSHAGSDQAILNPAIGPFDLALGWGREGIGHLDATIVQDLFPLGIHLVGETMMLTSQGVPSLDEPKDGMGVDVIRQRATVFKENRLKRHDMSPGGLSFEEGGIEDEAAILIEGGDQIPLLLRCGSPEVMGGIMLNQLTDVVG
jgi:hypothetical protein